MNRLSETLCGKPLNDSGGVRVATHKPVNKGATSDSGLRELGCNVVPLSVKLDTGAAAHCENIGSVRTINAVCSSVKGAI